MNLSIYVLILALLIVAVARAEVKRKKWTDKDINEIEKDWEKGDEEEDLENEFDHNKKLAQQRTRINWDDPEQVKRAVREDRFSLGGGGHKMMFVDLQPTQLNGLKSILNSFHHQTDLSIVREAVGQGNSRLSI